MFLNRTAATCVFGVMCAAGLAGSEPVCGVPVERVNEAIRFRVYWFGKASVGGYGEAGKTVSVDCLVGQSLTLIGIKPIYTILGRYTSGERSEWIYIQGGFDGTSPQDLAPYFANVEQSIAPTKRSFAETWEENRQTVDDIRSGRIPRQAEPRQKVMAVAESYRLPAISAPASQSQHLLDNDFVRRVLDLVRADLHKNMPSACPCTISVPYFGQNDPLLYVLVNFRDGQVAVDSFHRDPATGGPLGDDFLYHPNDPSHVFLVARLRGHLAVSEEVN